MGQPNLEGYQLNHAYSHVCSSHVAVTGKEIANLDVALCMVASTVSHTLKQSQPRPPPYLTPNTFVQQAVAVYLLPLCRCRLVAFNQYSDSWTKQSRKLTLPTTAHTIPVALLLSGVAELAALAHIFCLIGPACTSARSWGRERGTCVRLHANSPWHQNCRTTQEAHKSSSQPNIWRNCPQPPQARVS